MRGTTQAHWPQRCSQPRRNVLLFLASPAPMCGFPAVPDRHPHNYCPPPTGLAPAPRHRNASCGGGISRPRSRGPRVPRLEPECWQRLTLKPLPPKMFLKPGSGRGDICWRRSPVPHVRERLRPPTERRRRRTRLRPERGESGRGAHAPGAELDTAAEVTASSRPAPPAQPLGVRPPSPSVGPASRNVARRVDRRRLPTFIPTSATGNARTPPRTPKGTSAACPPYSLSPPSPPTPSRGSFLLPF